MFLLKAEASLRMELRLFFSRVLNPISPEREPDPCSINSKLKSARQLYKDIISSKYSIDKQFADKTVSQLACASKMLESSKSIPLSTAASVLVDLNNKETSRKNGLQHYPPCVTFTNFMTQINTYRLDEARKFSGRAVKP